MKPVNFSRFYFKKSKQNDTKNQHLVLSLFRIRDIVFNALLFFGSSPRSAVLGCSRYSRKLKL